MLYMKIMKTRKKYKNMSPKFIRFPLSTPGALKIIIEENNNTNQKENSFKKSMSN